MIDRQLEKNFQNTFVTATTVRSQLITVEALLLELLSNDRVSRVLAYFGCSKSQLKRNLEEFIDTKVPKLATLKEDPQPSVGFQRVIERPWCTCSSPAARIRICMGKMCSSRFLMSLTAGLSLISPSRDSIS